ncbi:hypothetical protein RchiOBHm_Chr4g0386641 [Rosa chinensis]|uniref:Uncharacterized protein n=1 Tax=Rosa chinensis TaxID=74649 RepID=A0A2P6QP82_ROSCH|nr:hypothetical protein RchiOBHm_Chr4g0386641 [Rosa chinensis]
MAMEEIGFCILPLKYGSMIMEAYLDCVINTMIMCRSKAINNGSAD